MSVETVTIRGPLLSIAPRLQIEESRLIAETPLQLRIMSFGAYFRRVTIDRDRQEIEIVRRRWWVRRDRKTIPFSRIEYVESEFESFPTSLTSLFQTADQVEWFTAVLVLKDPLERVVLATFYGEGSVMTGALGVMTGDSWIDIAGNQEESFSAFFPVLKRFLNVPVGLPIPRLAYTNGPAQCCTHCQRTIPPHRKECMYCGGPASSVGTDS